MKSDSLQDSIPQDSISKILYKMATSEFENILLCVVLSVDQRLGYVII